MLIQALFKSPVLRIGKAPCFFFSENLTSTFQSRSKLNEFYKYTHPDVLSQAPERVRDENLRSLKNLNAYLDSINQNKGVAEQRLRFYIAEKESVKNKKYFLFEVRLGTLKPETPEDLRRKHLEDCMNKLMSNLRDTLTRKGDLYKDAIDSLNQKTSEQEQKSLNDDFLYETGPFNKKITVERRLINKIDEFKTQDRLYNATYRSELKESMKRKIEQEIEVYEDGQSVKMWTNQLIKDIEEKWNHSHHRSFNFDVRLIYFDEPVTPQEVDIFMKQLNKTYEKSKSGELEHLERLAGLLEMYDPPLNLMIAKEYNNNLPGFITIPFDFDPKEALEYCEENAEDIVERRKELKKEYATVDKNIEALRNLTEFNSVSVAVDLIKDPDTLRLTNLCIKRLTTFFTSVATHKDEEHYATNLKIVSSKMPLRKEKNSLDIPINFEAYQVKVLLRKRASTASEV